jgi:futalosine hydrolase
MKRKYEFCLMQILLVAATANEIKLFINRWHNIDVLITGVGVPSAMYHLQKRLHQVDYDFVIQAGIAGAFTSALALGETVLVAKDTFGDLGIEEKNSFVPCTANGLVSPSDFPFTDGWLINNNAIAANTSFKTVSGVTINKVSDSILQKQQLINVYNPQVETMEGAALHYICLQESVPFVQLRAISNYVGERDKKKWEISKALENLNTGLQKLIQQLQ